jgi:hypothetical protein
MVRQVEHSPAWTWRRPLPIVGGQPNQQPKQPLPLGLEQSRDIQIHVLGPLVYGGQAVGHATSMPESERFEDIGGRGAVEVR